MKLQEKQMWATVQPQIQDAEKKISASLGAAVQLVINEDSFPSKDLIARIPDAALTFLQKGFEDFCADGIAKEAAQSTVKSIGIRQESVDGFKIDLKDNKLEVTANFAAGGTCGLQYPHQNDYTKFLSENL